jgi:hypothetical protein
MRTVKKNSAGSFLCFDYALAEQQRIPGRQTEEQDTCELVREWWDESHAVHCQHSPLPSAATREA